MLKLSAAALAYARQPGFSALVFSDVKPPTGPSAAYTQAATDDLNQMGPTVLTKKYSSARPLVVARSALRWLSWRRPTVVAQANDGADRWLRTVVSGRPLDGSVMQTVGNIGAITLKDGTAKAKVQLLPFDGDEYGVFAFVDSILLLNEAKCSERLSLTQRLMINPMVRSAATELIAVTEEAIARGTKRRAHPKCLRQYSAAQRRRRRFTSATCEILSTVPLRRLSSTSLWLPSRCRASCALMLSTPRCRLSRTMIATPMRSVAARRWARPLPVTRQYKSVITTAGDHDTSCRNHNKNIPCGL